MGVISGFSSQNPSQHFSIESTPSGTVEEIKVSQQEIKFIAEFLDNFDLDEDVEYDEEGNDVNKANNASGTQFKRKLFCLSFGLILCTFRF